jgi:hypothetical protein
MSSSISSSNNSGSGRSRKLSKIAAEKLEEKERKAANKSNRKKISNKRQAEEGDSTPAKVKKSKLATQAKKVVEANKKALIESSDSDDDFNMTKSNRSGTSSPSHSNMEVLPEDDRIAIAIDLLIQQRISAGKTVSVWPTQAEMDAATTNSALAITVAPRVTPQEYLFHDTIAKLSLAPDSAIFKMADICLGSEVPSGTVFFILPADSSGDTEIHDFYQVRPVPANRMSLRKATRIITSRGNAKANGNRMAIEDITDILFGPGDKLCTLPRGGVTKVLYLTNIVSWAEEEFFDEITVKDSLIPPTSLPLTNVGFGSSTSEFSEVALPLLPSPSFSKFVSASTRPSIRMASIPKIESVTSKYAHSSAMYQVSQQIINTAIVNSSKENKGDLGLLDALKASSSSASSATTMRKLGMNPHTLHVLSVAGSEALKATLSEVRKRFGLRVSCPITMFGMKHYIQSWMLDDQGHALKYFINLMEFHGALKGDTLAREFNSLDDLAEQSKAYCNLIKDLNFKSCLTDLRIMKDAVFNVLLLLFIKYNMRFKFQNEMLKAVDRLFVYIRKHDFGPSAKCSSDFIRLCIVELFRQFDEFHSNLFECRDDSDTDELLQGLTFLPDLEIDSPIDMIQQCMFHEYGHSVAQLLIKGTGLASSSGGGTNDEKVSPTSNKQRNKNKRDKQKEKKQQNPQLVSNHPSKNSTVIANSKSTTGGGLFCFKFNSKKGCDYKDKCKFKHAAPAKNSIEWSKLEEMFSDRGVEATDAFIAGGV